MANDEGNWEQSVMGWFIYMLENRPVSLIGIFVLLFVAVVLIAFHLA